MKDKKILLPLLIAIVFTLSGCGDNDDSENIEISEEKEWTYDMLEDEFGGIIETDCISVRDCLNELSWKDYYVCGYVTDTNPFYPSLLTISDDLNNSDSYNEIMISQNNDSDPLYANIGDFIYAKGENMSSSVSETYYLSCYTSRISDGYVSTEKIDNEYLTISDFLKLMDKIYNQTYFKTEGIVIQDGENYDGSPKYFLYPSEDGYKEDKFSRVELTFSEPQSNLLGKHIVVIGKPDKDATFQGLRECSIIEEK